MSSQPNGSTKSRFELPALNLNFGSITDGTDIPPPPKSPVQEKVAEKPPPMVATPNKEPKKEETAATTQTETQAAEKPVQTNGNLAGTKRPADDVPPSPTQSARPGSLRRLLSRTLLNDGYAEGQKTNGQAQSLYSRPESRSGASVMTEKKSRRSSGWFRRLTGGENNNKRASVISLDQPPTPMSPKKPTGPPPPMIPELKEVDDGQLGSDMFKNIR